MSEPSIPADAQPLDPVSTGIVVRLADEGIPVRAIARGVQVPSESIRDVLHLAIDLGQIVGMPRDDWPINVLRDNRSPTASASPSWTTRRLSSRSLAFSR